MAEGLDVELKQFKKLKAIDRDELIYQNILTTRTEIKNICQKINLTRIKMNTLTIWLFLLTVATGFKDYLPIN